MVKYAPVAPGRVLKALREYGDFVVGDYHLLLAHDVAASCEEGSGPKVYNSYLEALPKDSIVIMDNSVIELGAPVSASVMAQALRAVKSTYIVLPDMIRKKNQTIEMSRMAAKQYSTVLDSHQAFMVVPQGETLEELLECADELYKWIPRIGMFGVGRFVTGLLGTRAQLVSALHQKFKLPIHLLGFSDNLHDDIACCRLKGVIGIDSAVPVRLGQRGLLMDKANKTHDPRGDWWDTVPASILSSTIANLFLMRGWINGG